MLTPEQRARLAKLNRKLAQKISYGVGDKAPAPARTPATLQDVLPGTERETDGGRYYLIERTVRDFCRDDGRIDEEFLQALNRECAATALGQPHQTMRPLLETTPDRIVFLDIETCGFVGVPVFLIGLMNCENGGLVMRQFLARDYAEEQPLLAGVWEQLRNTDVLVTFNGKSFDVPMILDRAMVHRLFDCAAPPAHVDLLHESRRRWKKSLPNCRLQTLEHLVCGRLRAGDIPSSEIPAVYHEFVRMADRPDSPHRSRCLRELGAVVHHNALDLITMAELVTHILA